MRSANTRRCQTEPRDAPAIDISIGTASVGCEIEGAPITESGTALRGLRTEGGGERDSVLPKATGKFALGELEGGEDDFRAFRIEVRAR